MLRIALHSTPWNPFSSLRQPANKLVFNSLIHSFVVLMLRLYSFSLFSYSALSIKPLMTPCFSGIFFNYVQGVISLPVVIHSLIFFSVWLRDEDFTPLHFVATLRASIPNANPINLFIFTLSKIIVSLLYSFVTLLLFLFLFIIYNKAKVTLLFFNASQIFF